MIVHHDAEGEDGAYDADGYDHDDGDDDDHDE